MQVPVMLDPEREEDAVSVGRAFENRMITTVNHPVYQNVDARVQEYLTEINQREAVRRSSAKSVILTHALKPDQTAYLANEYPEFAINIKALNSPGHVMWHSLRVLANEWCSHTIRQLTSSFIHYGGMPMSHVFNGFSDAHIEMNLSDVSQMHQVHSNAIDMMRLYSDYGGVHADTGVVLNHAEYTRYLRNEAYSVCTKGNTCTHQAEGMVFDLTIDTLSPLQVAAAMVQSGANVAFGFFPYHPTMLVAEQGMLPGHEIGYVRTATHLELQYTQGVAGAVHYPITNWTAWLVGHTFGFDSESGSQFQVELLKSRDCMMFFRMTRIVAGDFVNQTITHALELSNMRDMVLVKTWKLRGLTSDPSRSSSWESHVFLTNKRLVDKVYQFGIQLSTEKLSRAAIRKQVKITNDRTVVMGTSVTVSPPLSPDQINSLTTAIFVKLFVDRYEMSQLSAELIARLKLVAGFGSLSRTQRMAAIFIYMAKSTWDVTFGWINQHISDFCDAIRRLVGGLKPLRGVDFSLAPTYQTFEAYVSFWMKSSRGYQERFVRRGTHLSLADVVDASPGGTVAWYLKNSLSRVQTSVDTRDVGLMPVTKIHVDMENTRPYGPDQPCPSDNEVVQALVNVASTLAPLDQPPEDRHLMPAARSALETDVPDAIDYESVIDPVAAINVAYEEAIPGVAEQNMEYDTASLSLDPQDRSISALYLKMPSYAGLAPAPRSYYQSKVKALNVPKRQATVPETLSAVAARNLSAPQVALPQDDALIHDVWETFLDKACKPEARQLLKRYQSDPVALEEGALQDWAAQAKPEAVPRVIQELERDFNALEEMYVNEYLLMIKADVKPTISTKPLRERTEPQVIVYHEKALSALFSCMFRMISRRFESLLRPEIMVQLRKSTAEIAQHVQTYHPFGKSLTFLENDFSKYDKSQSYFAFALEAHVFQQLGLNQNMLDKWLSGHVECKLRAVSLGLSLHTMYQRKSGDATTALGNTMLNIISVTYAYRATNVIWAIFMGDDSIVATDNPVIEGAISVLAEVFNLSAKNYITDAPYFASYFIIIDDYEQTARFVPDPVKRVEKLSMHITADEPQWEDRFQSFQDICRSFRSRKVNKLAADKVIERYAGLTRGNAEQLCNSMATLCESFAAFRAVWHAEPEVSQY